MKARVALGFLGVAGAAYGVWLLLAEEFADLFSTVVWLAAGVVLHDFVLVPLTLGASWLGVRLLPPGRRAPVAAGLVMLGTLTLMAVPVLGRWGANADNPTILDRNYTVGWLVVATLVLAGVVAGLLRARGPVARVLVVDDDLEWAEAVWRAPDRGRLDARSSVTNPLHPPATPASPAAPSGSKWKPSKTPTTNSSTPRGAAVGAVWRPWPPRPRCER